MIIVLTFIFGFALGILVYIIFEEGKDVTKWFDEHDRKTEQVIKKKEEVDAEGYTLAEKTSFWRIVRYRNGKFDCVWECGIFDKRVADKRCEKLNDPNEGNECYYGTYVVEK